MPNNCHGFKAVISLNCLLRDVKQRPCDRKISDFYWCKCYSRFVVHIHMKGNFQFPGEVTRNKGAIVFHIHKLWVKNPCERNTCTWRVLREPISRFFPKTFSTSLFIFPFSYYDENSTPLTHPECSEVGGSGCKPLKCPEWWENALLLREFPWEQARNTMRAEPCFMQTKGIRLCLPKMPHFGTMIILSWKQMSRAQISLCERDTFPFVKVLFFPIAGRGEWLITRDNLSLHCKPY